jgi:hypothetical protein
MYGKAERKTLSMIQPEINELNQLVNRDITIWHEPDPQLRREKVTQLWTEDASHFTRTREFHGYEELVERVEAAHEKFVQTQDYLFQLTGEVDAHHDAVKFSWEMVKACSGEVAATGTIFLLLKEDGRIHLDYQF